MQEYVTEFVAVQSLFNLVQTMLHVGLEGFNILRTVKIRVLVSSSYKVIGDVIRLPEMVAGYHPLVNSMTDSLVTVVLVALAGHFNLIVSQGKTEIQVDIAFLLTDSHHDTVHVLMMALDILPCPGDQDLAGLPDVAGLIFIRNAQRDDVQFHEILLE